MSKDNDTRTVVHVSDVARGPLVFKFIFNNKKSFTDVSLGLFSILNEVALKLGCRNVTYMQYTHKMLVILAIKRQYDFFPREIKQKILSRVTCDALHNRATFCNVIMLVNYSQVLHRSVNCFSDY